MNHYAYACFHRFFSKSQQEFYQIDLYYKEIEIPKTKHNTTGWVGGGGGAVARAGVGGGAHQVATASKSCSRERTFSGKPLPPETQSYKLSPMLHVVM